MKVAVMGCVVNGPGESKHSNIGISLPGTFEEPKAPVYVDGRLYATLKGDRIVAEFIEILSKASRSSGCAPEIRVERGRKVFPPKPRWASAVPGGWGVRLTPAHCHPFLKAGGVLSGSKTRSPSGRSLLLLASARW
jgi:hypothetical protein